MKPLNLQEYQAAAQEVLPPAIYAIVAAGSDDEVTLRANRAAFDQWRLLPRMWRGYSQADPRTTVLGQEIAMPVILTPVATHTLVHPQGELASAAAARRAGTIFTLGTCASTTIEAVAKAAGPWWFQLYFFPDRAIARDLIQRAEGCGASAIVITIDSPVLGRHETALRQNAISQIGDIAFANVAPDAMDGARHDPTQNWKDLEWLAARTALPLIVKGVLDPADARCAVDLGARALVVSNHGGRQLDSAVTSLDALPAVVEAVKGDAEILIDGGFRRGTDVLKALALGARAILLGRPFLWGLAVDGEEGVCRVLTLLCEELVRDMLLGGRGTIAEIDRSFIVPVGPLPYPRLVAKMTTPVEAALAYLDTRHDQLIGFLRELIATPSITIDMGERAVADLLIAHTRGLGLADPETAYRSAEHPNLLYHLAGADPGRTLILNAHFDTQPVGDGAAWSRDPFAGSIEGDRLYGLGSSDMKGAVAAMVYALAALTHAGAPNRGSLILALVANEEDGGAYGADWLTRDYGLTGDACVVGEPSGVHQEWEGIYNAQRGQSAVWVRTTGRQMHSGVAHAFGAVNAAVHMARVIDALDRELVITSAADPEGARANPTLGVLVRCGDAWGINPGVAEFGVDVRTVPGMVRDDVARGFDEALARIRRIRPEIAADWRFHDAPWDWIAPTYVAPDSAVMRAAAGAAADILGIAPPSSLYPATTDASAFATVAGIPTIAALGPGCIGRAHRADEYVSIKSVIDAAKLYVTLALRYLEEE